jgi:LysR family transcriptional activator of nhaA
MKTTLPNHLHPDLAAFIETVRLGTVSAAARALRLSQPATSARLANLARRTGGALFVREGRLLRLTSHGARVHDGAQFVLRSCESMDAALRNEPTNQLPLRVGTADAVPKIIVRRILLPLLRNGIRIECREWHSEHLERELSAHRLDMLITDREPVALRSDDLISSVAARSGIVLSAEPGLARRLRVGFPASLNDASLALPAAPGPLRDRIDRWLRRHAPKARIILEAEDRALLHHFAESHPCAVPLAKTAAVPVERQFGLARIGELPGVDESYYVIRSKWRTPSMD